MLHYVLLEMIASLPECNWATFNIQYIAPSHQFLKSVLSFFRFCYISKCYRFLKNVLSFSKPQLNFQKVKMSRILLSINLNFGCSTVFDNIRHVEPVEMRWLVQCEFVPTAVVEVLLKQAWRDRCLEKSPKRAKRTKTVRLTTKTLGCCTPWPSAKVFSYL